MLGLEEVLMLAIGLGLIAFFEPITSILGLLLVGSAFGLDAGQALPG